jgi:uncharacterized NAD(P)/FAD-binding protein YdhS
LAALLHRLSAQPIEIILCDKSGRFGAGPAYSTPFSYHLLNVRAQDMSAFEDIPTHFTDWLNANPETHKHFDTKMPIAVQFAPRCLYHDYLQYLLNTLKSDKSGKLKIIFETVEVTDVETTSDHVEIVFRDQRRIKVDKVVLAIGNNPPSRFPFPVDADIQCIHNPWDYQAVNHIPKQDPVLIVGTGLSMIDAVLSLYHQQHQGMIYAVSRHGLLPLPHADISPLYPLDKAVLATGLPGLTKQLRLTCKTHMATDGDWRSVVNALRLHIPHIWENFNVKDKKRFLRHLLPYWNIHRHRVHTTIMDLLSHLINQQQFKVLSGRVVEAKQGAAKIKLRHQHQATEVPARWLINCMGPAQYMGPEQQPLLNTLIKRQLVTIDTLGLGFVIDSSCALKDASGKASNICYAAGAPTKGALWEIGAVPEIRRQIFDLAGHLLAKR